LPLSSLLLILTDGKPNDLDMYEGRYGIEDTKQAILTARTMGLKVFCVTIDEKVMIICLIYLVRMAMHW
jgi:Nitric oxide reductase activation protein